MTDIEARKYSVSFNSYNTWTSWGLIPVTRPVINPPTRKEKYIDIPGANGMIDLSNSLTNDMPVYNNREGSLEFYVVKDDKTLNELYSEIMNALSFMSTYGTNKMILEEDSEYYYEGYFFVNEPKVSRPWSTITIDYKVSPYKWSNDIYRPFNREYINSPNTWKVLKSLYPDNFGEAPVSPEIIVSSTDKKGMDFSFSIYGTISNTHLKDGSNKDIPNFIIWNNEQIDIQFKGIGYITMECRRGSL